MSYLELLYSVFIFLCFASSTWSLNNTSHIKCSAQQRNSLLMFKKSLTYLNLSIDVPMNRFTPCKDWLGSSYYPKLMNWNTSTDCCNWDGVTCDHSTGDVIGIDVSCGMLQGTIYSNTSLFNLPRLKKLNLAYNVFAGSQLPPEIGRLSNSLTLLNLSFCLFSGPVPMNITLLHKLVSLDMSLNRFTFEPHVLNNLLRNSTNLEKLSLIYITI